jgi:hypothetical protein
VKPYRHCNFFRIFSLKCSYKFEQSKDITVNIPAINIDVIACNELWLWGAWDDSAIAIDVAGNIIV